MPPPNRESPVVLIERRGRLLLGALRPPKGRKIRFLGEGNESLQITAERILHRFGPLSSRDDRGLRRALRGFREDAIAAAAATDLRRVWEWAEADRGYGLLELAAAHDEGDDADEAACIRLFGALADDQILFELRSGKFVKRPADLVEKDAARRALEAAKAAEDDALVAWLESAEALEPDALAPRGDALDAARDWALRGEDGGGAPRGRAIARRIGAATADEALAVLEERGLLPRDVNELPDRLGLPAMLGRREAQAVAELVDAAPPAAGPASPSHGPPAFAIDDAETDEVDDAIGVELTAEGGVRVHVHIACVAASIEPGSVLDASARRRLSTVYFPGGKLPMFAPSLIAGRLSLEEGGPPRPTLTGIFELGPDGTATAPARFVETTVTLRARVTYEETPRLAASEEPFGRLTAIAHALRERRFAAGAHAPDLPELRIRMTTAADGTRHPETYRLLPTTPGHLVVSELMVLYNRELARLLVDAGAPAVFRVQPQPIDREALPADDDPLRAVRMRRLLPPASVSLEPGPHRSIGVEAYVQATSPIRRYVDLVAQRQARSIVRGERTPPHDAADVATVCHLVASRERGLRRAEGDRIEFLLLRSLERRIGQSLDAIVSRPPRPGERRGHAFLPEILREMAFELPIDAGGEPAPIELAAGQRVSLRIAAVHPRRRQHTFTLETEGDPS